MTALPVEQVGPHTWAVTTHHVGGKVGIVIGSESTLFVDAGAGPGEGARIAATGRVLGGGHPVLVLTHGHWDHVRGWVGMRDVEAHVHTDAWPSARSQLSLGMREAGAVGGERKAVVMAGPWTMDLGGVTVEVIETPGHAPGSVCARVIEDGVLFGGDTVVTAIPPVFSDGHSTILERTLRHLALLDVEAIVPGHGYVVRGSTSAREAMLRRADHLALMRERVEALYGPHDADGVAAVLALSDPADGPFDMGLVPTDDLVVRHERMVRALLGEAGLRPVDGPAGP